MSDKKCIALFFKVFILMTLVFLVAMTCCACGEDSEEETVAFEQDESQLFVVIEYGKTDKLYQYIMYDPVTKNMYTYVEWADGGGLSLIYEADGVTPRKYTGN